MTTAPGAAEPVRTCVGCRRTDRQRALVRVARADGRLVLDARRRLPGRGAYLHADAGCWREARGGLSRSLRTSVTDREVGALRSSLPAVTPASREAHDPARALLGAATSDSGLLRRDVVDIATRSKA